MRKKQFQLKTTIYEENGVIYVEKAALHEIGKVHIQSFAIKYEKMKNCNENIELLKPSLYDGAMRYPYVEGKLLSHCLYENIQTQNPKEFLQNLRSVLHLIFDVKKEYQVNFSLSEHFVQVFGEQVFPPDTPALKISNIDCLFDNILVAGDGFICLDYEWVFPFPIPVEFITYRMLYYFYLHYQDILKYDSMLEFLAEFGISLEKLDLYQDMENHFQEYVHGLGREDAYLVKYAQEKSYFSDLQKAEGKIQEQLERILELQAEVKERNYQLRQVQEKYRLTQNHVQNLESMILDLNTKSEEQKQQIEYYKEHESLSSKAKQTVKEQMSNVLPVGSKKRKFLSYTKKSLLHPIKSTKLYLSEEGRNKIQGDFNIGSGYLEHGVLEFSIEEKPKVSIIIPVYNQIHYTYACLLSILKNTKNISYEVVVADDCSDDATKDLERYTKNVRIIHWEKNLGFLKSCNEAAKATKGQYLLFLNNDTEVCENWLRSLVDLIESNSQIGMVGSKLVYPDGKLQEAGGILWSDGSGWNYGRGDDPTKEEYNYVREVDYLSGASILLPKNLWEEIGGFDERYAPAYCEDSDLAFSVRKKGLQVVYQPLSVVVHHEGISHGKDEETGIKAYQVENTKKLVEKWKDEFEKQYPPDPQANLFLAKERAGKKKFILFVDHYVPRFDQDAGSKTTFQYLKLFLQKGFIVKFITDNYLKEEPYTTQLQQMGIEVLYGAQYESGIWDWIQQHKDFIQFAYLNRPHIASKYVDYLRDYTQIKLIYYGHDLHFLREYREYKLTGDEEKRKFADSIKLMELALLSKMDISYYPSVIEIKAIEVIDASLAVKAIRPYIFEHFSEEHIFAEDMEKRKGMLFVGGFTHLPNKDAMLWFCKEIYPLISREQEIPLVIAGSQVPKEIEELDEKHENGQKGIHVRGYVPEDELKRLYKECRMSVVPLRYGAGVKGKIIEALYYGVPVVTTSVGAEGILGAESVMEVIDSPMQMAEKILSLYSDVQTLSSMSNNGLEYVKRYYSVESAWRLIEEDFA